MSGQQEFIEAAKAVESAEFGLARSLKGTLGRIVWGFAAVVALYHILFIAGVFFYLGFDIYPATHDALSLGLMLTLTFLWIPATKDSPKHSLPWYDIVAIVLSLTVSLYLAVNYINILEGQNPSNTLEQVLGVIAIILVLEAVRRAIGWVLTIMGIMFVLYPLVGYLLPGFLYVRPMTLQRLIDYVYLYPEGIYGPILHVIATVIVPFLVFGAFLRVSGAGDWFVNLAMALLGHVRGGPAKVAVFASALFGTINGSAVANIASVGVVTIPLMKSVGYQSYFAGAVETVASNGGQIMPPVMGIAAFIMMDFLNMSYTQIMVAAAVPAILYFVALLMMVDFEAARTGLRGLPRAQLPPLWKTFLDGWFYLIPIVVLLVLMLVFWLSAPNAGVYASACVILVSLFKKKARIGPRKLVDGLAEGAKGLPQVGVATAVGGFLTAILFLTGFGFKFSQGAVLLAGDNVPALLVMGAVASLILGTAMPTTATYILTALLVAPALITMGMLPLAAHFFVFYFGMAATITPPVCVVAFVGASIAGAPLFRTAWEAMRLGIVVYLVPFALAFSPALLLVGSPNEIGLAVFFATVGIVCLSGALGGYLLVKTNWLERILLLASGALLFGPPGAMHFLGLAGAIVAFIFQGIKWRLRSARTEAGYT